MKKLYIIAFCGLIGAGSAAAQEAPAVATFENLTLAPESAWHGDENGDEWYYGLGYSQRFVSGGYSFVNDYIPDYDSWCGYAYSNITSTEYTSLADQYKSCIGHGYDGSGNYCVAYCDGTMWGEPLDIQVVDGAAVVPGFYVVNSAYTAYAINVTDGMTDGPFGEGDYFQLNIFALDAAGDVTATRSFMLADYRAADPADRYYIKDWTYVDLSRMGEAAGFKFTFEGSRNSDWGLTTPGYMCIDNFGDTGEETGGIAGVSVDTPTPATGIYTLRGIRVSDMSRPGIYIVNGKKIIKK